LLDLSAIVGLGVRVVSLYLHIISGSNGGVIALRNPDDTNGINSIRVFTATGEQSFTQVLVRTDSAGRIAYMAPSEMDVIMLEGVVNGWFE